MKIPEGTEPGYYWVKLGDDWIPASIWKSVAYGDDDWRIAFAGIQHTFADGEDGLDELGPRLEPPAQKPDVGEAMRERLRQRLDKKLPL